MANAGYACGVMRSDTEGIGAKLGNKLEGGQLSVDASSETQTELGGKYFTFGLGDEEYGLEILKVREIIGLMEITTVPRTPEYVRGVINLRGKIIPVIDLRVKFGMEQVAETEETCIIVVEATRNGTRVDIGILVDRVREVLDIKAEDIDPPPPFGQGFEGNYILGMAKAQDSVKILLDVDTVLSTEEVVDVQGASSGANSNDEAV